MTPATAHVPDAAPVTTGTVALIVPGPEAAELQEEFRRQGQSYVTVTPPLHTLPLNASAPTVADTDTVLHQSLRSTVRHLRARGVSAVMPGSSLGLDLAARLAEQLGLPGNEPSNSVLRRDRGAQASAWARAGLSTARTQRSSGLPAAVRWAKFVALPELVVAPGDTSVSGPARVCAAHADIAAAWTRMRTIAHRQSGSRHVVLQERIPGRQYTVRTTTHEGQHTVTEIWALTHTPNGLRDFADLVPTHGLLHRSLTHLAQQALTALGVQHGAMRIRIAHPEHGPVLLSARLDVAPPPAQPASRLHTRRVELIAPADGTLNRRLLRSLHSLPTLSESSGELRPGALVPRTIDHLTSPGTLTLTGGPAAVETDYQTVRSLEARGLYNQVGGEL
ncbi:hypothetical protein ACIQU6_32800 [Streptomyces sp. NPDC090442]|uniref:hypothetical protein n=1 Tax=Streptomyces sp. NPDC090442 TaxID=3365962 RepID=UPI00382663BD